MNIKDYDKNVLKTVSGDIPAIKERITDESTLHMLHAAIGMCTEASELLDMLKKHIFYGKDIDFANLDEEIGDLCWYQSLALHSARLKHYNTCWENVWEKNIEKLRARYGDKFDEEKANNRDLDKERGVLEK